MSQFQVDPRTVTLEGIVPVIPISKRLVPTDLNTSFRAYMKAALDRLATLLRSLYNTTPQRVQSIFYQQKIDGRNAVYRIAFRPVDGQSRVVTRSVPFFSNAMTVEEQELILLYNKLLVIENESWVRTVGRLSVNTIENNTQQLMTSIKPVNLQDILFLQYGYDLAIGNLSTFLPWRIVRQSIRFRSLNTPLIIPGTQGLTVNWVADTLEIEYGAYQNMGLPFAGDNVIVYSSQIIRPNNPRNNEFLQLLERATNAWDGDARTSIEEFQYKLGLQYDYLEKPDRLLESQLRAAAVNPNLRVTVINASQARRTILESQRNRAQQLAMELEFNPEQLLQRELQQTIQRANIIKDNDEAVLEQDLEELESLGREEDWEPEQLNRAILLRRDIQRLRDSIAQSQQLINEKNATLSNLESVSGFVESAINERENARRIVTGAINQNRNTTVNVDNNANYVDEGFGTILSGSSSLNINASQVLPVLVQSNNLGF